MTQDFLYKGKVAIDPGYTYLNTAQCGPLMVPVAEEISAFHEQQKQYGCLNWMNWLERRESCRKNIARLVNADPRQVSFVSSTSQGISTMAFLLHQAGKRKVVSTDAEFVTTVLPWRHYGFDVQLISTLEGVVEPERVKEALGRGADVFITGHIHSYTGFRNNLQTLGSLCREAGTLFAVNATQSAGVFPIDLQADSIDMLTFSGFKWLLAGYGTGALYVNRERIPSPKGPLTGWMGLKDPYTHDLEEDGLREDGRALEHGAPDFARVFGLDRAIAELSSMGIENVRQRILNLSDLVRQEARQRDIKVLGSEAPEHKSGIVALQVHNAPNIVQTLRDKKIISSARNNVIRVATHFFNTNEDIVRFYSELDVSR